jgi:hypothetical protein
VLED